jgi:hypothetical protein
MSAPKLKHIVFFRMKEKADGQSAEVNGEKLMLMLKALPSQIAEIRSFEIGPDILKTPASWDIALDSSFDSLEDLETYRVHPAHQEVVEWVKLTTSERAVADFWVE